MSILSHLLARERQFELATNYVQNSKELSEKLDFKKGEANAYNILGIIYAYKSNYPEALKNFSESLKQWQKIGNKKGVANSYNHIGSIYESQGNYPEALKNYFSSLKIYEEILDKEGIAMSYNGIGIVYRKQDKIPEAFKNYSKALKIYEDIGDKRGIAESYNNIGLVYEAQGKYLEALENYFASLKIKKELGNKRGIAGSYHNIGVVYQQQGKYSEALENYLAALKILKEIEEKWGIAMSYNNIGLLEYKLNRPASAKKHFDKALILSQEIGQKELIADIYYNYSLVDNTLGNYKDAYENYKQYIVYRDSLVNQENEKKSLEVSMGYEYDKKAAVIQAELKTKQLQRNAAFAGLGIMGVLAVFIVYFFRLRNKKLEIEKQNLELQRREMEVIKENEQFKSRFLTNISHEFRTPLTLINGHVEVLKENGREEDFSHFDEIEQNGKRLLTLINQLLDLSKMESGQYKLEYKKGNVLNEANMLVQSFYSYAEQHGISLILQQTEKAKILSERPFVFSSEALAMIMTNLLSNAIKYTPVGGSVTASIDYQNDKLFITITDTGQGISKEHLSKIFDRFYQVDEPGQRTYAGSGIGLALVKELTLLHGGDIKVDSPDNGGCVFTFWLESSKTEDVESIDSVEQKTDFPSNEEIEIKNNELQNAELPLLLIIEDQPDLRSFIVQNLGEEYRYAEASNGKDGMKLAKELLPDLIISDVMMPDADGFELCETLKNDVITSHIPIILLTAKAEQKDKLTGLETGADDYLTKPFSLAELKLRVRNILSFKELLRKKFEGSTIPSAEEIPELSSRDLKFVEDVTELVEKNISNLQFGVNILAEGVFLSVSQLTRKLKTITGKTPADFIRNMRLEKAIELLKKGESVAQVSWTVGFEDPVYFSKVFKKHFGFSPSSVKR
ncbi:hybrid sensor histidine kinase/response regulator transcription factor [Myroides indicus]|nr:tetratricopeptide repeat protein [Myroides indicus]